MGRKEWLQIQSANHSDEPLNAILVSAKASTMIRVSYPSLFHILVPEEMQTGRSPGSMMYEKNQSYQPAVS